MVRPAALTTIFLLVSFGDVWASCLTHSEARAKWPKEHLYWHTEHHCWDNSRTWASSRRALAKATALTPPRPEGPPKAAVPIPKPIAKKLWKEPDLPECCWPPLESLLPDLHGHITGEPK